ncbi:DUF222 domain-containing protein [Actinomyces sp. F1_1611]
MTLSQLSDQDLLDLVAQTGKLQREIDARLVELTQEVQERCAREISLAHQVGCRDATDVWSRFALSAPAATKSRVRLARQLMPRLDQETGEKLGPAFPHTAHEFSQGNLTSNAAKVIVNSLRDLPEGEERELAEQVLVASAAGYDQDGQLVPALALSLPELRTQAETWRRKLDAPSRTETFETRRVDLVELENGMFRLSGVLVAEGAAVFTGLFSQIANPKLAGEEEDPRTPAQRRHDSLIAIGKAAADSPAIPKRNGQPFTVIVQVEAEDVAAGRGGYIHESRPTLIDQAELLHAACGASFQFVAQGDNGQIVELGSPERVFTPVQRAAIAARDGGCVIPGCNTEAAWCEIHHVTEWARGGPTHVSNGAMLCWYHHRNLGSSGWKIRIEDGIPWYCAPEALDPDQKWRATQPIHAVATRLIRKCRRRRSA